MKFTLLGASTALRDDFWTSPSKVVEFDSEESLLEELNKNQWVRNDDGDLFRVVTIINGLIE